MMKKTFKRGVHPLHSQHGGKEHYEQGHRLNIGKQAHCNLGAKGHCPQNAEKSHFF